MKTNLISARILAGAGCAFLLALPAAARADRVIDAFSDPFPMTTLPGSSSPAPMVWTGTLAGSSQPQDSASQDNLAGVLGRQRFALVEEDTGTNLLVAASTGPVGAHHELSYATSSGKSGVLTLQYGALRNLNADLLSDGALAFELAIEGDMDDGAQPRPVQLTVTVHSGGASPAQATRTIASDGVYQIPFSAFAGANFSDVDFLMFELDASQVSSIDYALVGGLRTTGCLQPAGSARADRFLDTFVAALPLQYLPGAGMVPILWAGTFGGVSKNVGVAPQTGVAGVIGGQRTTTIAASALSNFLNGAMSRVDATPAFSYATGYPTSGKLTFAYGAQSDLNANLSNMAAFELELSGDLDSGTPRPVPLTVTVESGAASAATQVTLLAEGTYYIPFSAFSGVNFADVDFVQFHFDASQVQAVDFTLIGGLRASACVP
jgi:hypothetical protein